MAFDKYSWWNFIAKTMEFIKFLFSFFKSKKEENKQNTQNAINKVEQGYNKIDKENRPEKLNDRLQNLF
jgi:hypothetical protein